MKIFGIPVFPDQASTFAKDVDALSVRFLR